MADFTITHRIEAPELVAALNNLADALKARPVAVPTVPGAATHPAPETPVQAATTPAAPVVDANPTPAPVTPAVQNTAPAAPTVAAPTPVPVTPAPAPAEKVYTFDDITAAGSQLLELGKMNQLMELLKGYGVQAVTQLKPEQYADVAAGLRGLGAKI